MALYHSPDYQTSFESVCLSVQEKKFNIDLQDGGRLGFPVRMILAIFDLQVTLILPIKFRVNWSFGSEKSNNNINNNKKKTKKKKTVHNRFSAWLPGRTSWIFDQNVF